MNPQDLPNDPQSIAAMLTGGAPPASPMAPMAATQMEMTNPAERSPLSGSPQLPPDIMELLAFAGQPMAPEKPPTKREIIGNALGDFLVAMGQGLANRGKGGQSTGAGAAMMTPTLMARQRATDALQKRQMEFQQHHQTVQQRLQEVEALIAARREGREQAASGADIAFKTAQTNAITQKPVEPAFTLNPGDVRFDASGKPIASVPANPPKPPDQTPEEKFISVKLVEAIAKNGGQPLTTGQEAAIRGKARGEWSSFGKDDEGVIEFTPQALDKMAEMFATTGQLPPMGMGKESTRARSRIINRAAKLFPNVDFATEKAAFQANQSSLTALTKNRDAVVSFENTASKNLDQFIATAQKVVDKGSPLINRPLRTVNIQALGGEDQAAFNAAQRVALNEIARVTSNPNLTGVLSDAARKEIEGLVPAGATLKQILSVTKILKADMKNRHDSLDEQIDAIQGRIKINKTTAPDAFTLPNGTVVRRQTDGTYK